MPLIQQRDGAALAAPERGLCTAPAPTPADGKTLREGFDKQLSPPVPLRKALNHTGTGAEASFPQEALEELRLPWPGCVGVL